MKYIDVSKPLFTGMKKYPSDPSVVIKRVKSFKKGNSCNLSKITMGSHSGTHIDAPSHILNGSGSVDAIEIEKLILKVVVLGMDSLPSARTGSAEGVLFKKGRKKAYLTEKDAHALLRKGIKLVGTESSSIEKSHNKRHPVHRLLLRKGVVIVENLDLRKAKPGRYSFFCLPLRIEKGDGSPVRAVLKIW
ncbi:MAG: cyclase family protein [Candidatus Omnitrophica bacterium]|nr:cyclase family protein [Candidatus Omnitrophota bacterium]